MDSLGSHCYCNCYNYLVLTPLTTVALYIQPTGWMNRKVAKWEVVVLLGCSLSRNIFVS